MRSFLLITAVAAIIGTAASSAARAADKTYQVTGPVTEVSSKSITVDKSGEKWQIARGDAAIPKNVKPGSKVTVHYSMTATSVTAKE